MSVAGWAMKYYLRPLTGRGFRKQQEGLINHLGRCVQYVWTIQENTCSTQFRTEYEPQCRDNAVS